MAARQARVRVEIDHWPELRERLRSIRGAAVAIGIQGTEARLADPDEPAVSVLDKATRNELGLGVPERPAIRSAFDAHISEWASRLERHLRAWLVGQMPAETALNLVGVRATADTKQVMVQWSTPPNAEATIAEKGFDNPLVRTGQLVNSVRHLTTLPDGRTSGTIAPGGS